MSRPYLVSSRLLLCALLLSSSALAQTHRRTSPGARPAASPSAPSEARLATLLAAQQQALQQNDPAAIEAATRPLAALLFERMADLALADADYPTAIRLSRQAVLLAPSPETHLQLASLLLRSGASAEAAAEAAIVTAAQPEDASAWVLRGSALRSLHDDQGSIQAFSRALELRSSVDVAYALASSLLAAREKDKADRIFHQIITASGNAAIWHVAAGDAYREALYLDDAIAEFNRAIAIDPRAPHAEFFLGLTWLKKNEWGPSSQSFEHLRAAVRNDPHDYLSNFYLGALESTDGSDLASSNRHLRAAIDANPTSPEAWIYLGLNASREHNTADAKTFLRKALALTGDDEARNNYQIRRVYAVLGRILISEGNHAEGDPLIEKYRATERRSMSNSAQAIAQAAGRPADGSAATPATPHTGPLNGEGDGAMNTHADLGGIAVPPAAFPGAATGLPGSDSAARTTPLRQSPEEARQIAAARKEVAVLLGSALNDLGTAQARQGQYDAALANFQEAEHWQAPPSPSLLRNLGIAAYRVGQFDESARALGLYLAAQPSSPASSGPAGGTRAAATPDDRSREMLAMSLFSLGRFADAARAFSAASSLTLQDPRAAYSWAYSLAHSGGQQEANKIADSLSTQPLPSDVLSLVCHLYMDTENYDAGIGCYRRALQADPALKLAHYQIGEALTRLDRPAEAVPELRQELLLSPGNPDVQYSLAFALLQSSHKDEALALLRSITNSAPTHAPAQYQLGKALLEDGNASEAVQHLELAEKSDPSPDYIHYQLQAAYRKAGRLADADRELKIYRDIKSKNREIAPRPQGAPAPSR